LRAPNLTGRPSAVVAAALITILAVNVASSDVFAAKAPRGLARFTAAVGSVESGGDYTARNPVSGAYGKYQIMPSNWPAWARQYLGNAKAKQTPHNQDRVAAGKMTSLHRWLGNWRRVAYWWLTGSSRTSGWSSYAKRYVAKVIARYRHGAVTSRGPAALRILNERSSAIVYRGTWRLARHGSYGGDAVRYAQSKGASATVRFTARKIAWHGPTGPTRGKAKVYVDGRYVKTVDLRRAAFDARGTLFRTGWSTVGKHSLTIVVVGSKGRAMVAIDDFTILR
jgi:transglycosylase-like protein with SLT domain